MPAEGAFQCRRVGRAATGPGAGGAGGAWGGPLPGALCGLPPGRGRGSRGGSRPRDREDRRQAELLASIVQPHAEVAPQSIAFDVETADGETHSALIARETTTQVVLRLGGGQERVLDRRQVRSMRSSGLSLMPEGLLAGLAPEAVADLLAFVAEAPAPVPAAAASETKP